MENELVTLEDMYRVWEREKQISMLHGEMRQLAALFLTEKTGAIIFTRLSDCKIWLRLINGYVLNNFSVYAEGEDAVIDRPLIIDIGCNPDLASHLLFRAERVIVLDEAVANGVSFKPYYIRN